ncbi:MAG: isochorismatase family cysteine hydrolase [Polyangiaceae bacterium]
MSAEGWVFVDVDVQRDLCEPDGALSVPGSPNDTFRRLVEAAVTRQIPIVGSVDSHAYDAWEFASNDNRGPAGEDPRFPDHCVKGTEGWLKVDGTLPPRFRFVPDEAAGDPGRVSRYAAELASGKAHGLYFEKEVYSVFANPMAERVIATFAELRGGIDELRFAVFGVATDYCVRAAVLGLRERGYRTVLVEDAIAGIDEGTTSAALDAMTEAGAERASVASLIRGLGD